MLSLKKSFYIVLIGFTVNCCAMEEDEQGNTRPIQGEGSKEHDTPNNEPNAKRFPFPFKTDSSETHVGYTAEEKGKLKVDEDEECEANEGFAFDIDPWYEMPTLREYGRRNGWLVNRQINDNHAERIFNSLPQGMRSVLREFANEESRTTGSYYHALILEGQPGVGKSTAGFAIAQYFNFAHLFVRATSLATEYKNSATQNIAALLEIAKVQNKPVLITIDEISSLLDRHKQAHNYDPGILEAFFQAIDSLEMSQVFVILTTNGLDKYPENFIDRFKKYTFKMPLPSEESKRVLIELLVQSNKLSKEKTKEEWIVFVSQLSGLLSNYREIQALFQKAYDNAQLQYDSTRDARTKTFPIRVRDLQESQILVLQERHSNNSGILKRTNKLLKKYSPSTSFWLGILGVVIPLTGIILTHYYFKSNRKLSIKQAKQATKQAEQQAIMMAQQFKRQDNLLAITNWKEEYIRKRGGVFQWIPGLSNCLRTGALGETNKAVEHFISSHDLGVFPTDCVVRTLNTIISSLPSDSTIQEGSVVAAGFVLSGFLITLKYGKEVAEKIVNVNGFSLGSLGAQCLEFLKNNLKK